jgi:hypothetical protein
MHPQTYRGLREARDFMRYAYGRPISLPDVAEHANLSPYHFLRVYKRAYGETPHEFLSVGLPPSEYRRYARSSISVPLSLRPLFVPSCFLAMLYGPAEESNFREAGIVGPVVSSGQ